MSIVDKIQRLMKLNHIESIAELEKKIGLSNGTIRRWPVNKPSIEKIQKVADYFNVSVDYLISRTDNPYIELPPKVEQVVAYLDNSFTDEELEDIQNYIAFIKLKRK